MPIDSGNLALKGLDDLFSTEENRQEEQREQVQQIPIDALHPFTNHPFKVLDDEAMTRTVESIAQYGVLAPLIARPRPDGDAHFVHFKDVTINQTAIPSADAVYLDALLQSSPYNCTNSSIHTRCVPAACQYTNRFDHNFLLHSANWQIFSTKKEILYYDL